MWKDEFLMVLNHYAWTGGVGAWVGGRFFKWGGERLRLGVQIWELEP